VIPAPASLTTYGRRIVEQARRLRVHPNTIQRWIRHHGLVATFVGGCWHVRDSDLDVFFTERTARRLKKPVPIDSRAHDAADRALTEGGW
jgi:excisionase family DNA binding protein